MKVFRNAAITVANSIKKGQPVTVNGRFRTSEWEGEGGTRTDLVIDATSVGHDLTRGTAEFTRAFGDASLASEDDAADEGGEDGTEGEAADGSEAGDEATEQPAELALSA